MDDGSHPIVRRHISSFSSTSFLPLANVLSPLRVSSIVYCLLFHRSQLIVPSFSAFSSIVYSCCKWCEAASIKMPSHLSVWMSVYCSCCERRNDFVMQIRFSIDIRLLTRKFAQNAMFWIINAIFLCYLEKNNVPLWHHFKINDMKQKDLNRIKLMLVERKRTTKWLAGELHKDPATISKWCTNSQEKVYKIN